MRIAQRSIEEVREAANIVEVTSEFTALRRQGARFAGLCPYPDHQEKTPSFSVAPDRGFYYCFGCQRGGDAIKLVMDLKSFDFAEAVSYLAERSGVDLQFEGGGDPGAAKARTDRRRKIHKTLAAAAVYYHKYLLKAKTSEAEQARRYLKDRRLVLSTIEEFRLGYAPPRGVSGFLGAARRLGFGREILEAAGLVSSRGGERFAGRVTFPISDRRGRIVGFGARALGDAQPKYLNSPETEIFNKRDLLYGFPQVSETVRRERAALVVEGYTDVLMLYQSGIKNAVATLGTATTPSHLRSLSRDVDRLFVLFDPDTAGERAIERVTETAIELKLDVQVLRLTHDPADWLVNHSKEDFLRELGSAVQILEYSIRRKAELARKANTAERSRLLTEMLDLIRPISDPVFREDALRIASEDLNVSQDVLRNEIKKRATRTQEPAKHQTQVDFLEPIERELLTLSLSHPELVAEFFSRGLKVGSLAQPIEVTTEDFSGSAQAQVFTLLQKHAGQRTDVVLADPEARPYLDLISALISEGDRNVFSLDRKGETLEPSRVDAAQAWIGLKLSACERARRRTRDLDEKHRIWNRMVELREALRAVASHA